LISVVTNTLRAAVILVLLQVWAVSAPVRISFLTESASTQDTLQVLRDAGCKEDGLNVFRQAVNRYSSTSFEFDFSKFPAARDGFYSFASASNLVAALPHPLCDTQHAYEFNCFDTVIAIAGEFLHTSVRPDDALGPFLVPHTPTNGSFLIVPRTTARDAFTLAYPDWYRDATEAAFPEAQRNARITTTAALFSCYLLPQSAAEGAVRDSVLTALRSSWKRQNLKFPTKFEVVLCHEVSLPQRFLVTAHAGLLLPRERGYTYIEKPGGKGPFVRLDFIERADLLTWFAAMFKGAERLGYTHHFVTFNDAKIESLNVPRADDQQQISRE
jgi:hypothetical protein